MVQLDQKNCLGNRVKVTVYSHEGRLKPVNAFIRRQMLFMTTYKIDKAKRQIMQCTGNVPHGRRIAA